MDLTVIIVTYNRCQSLAKTLESVAASSLPRSVEWEVLVVDNDSTDQTRQVVEDFRFSYPGRFRYLSEPNPGKSFGLNAGILDSRGNILAFIDDDVTVESTWLQNLTAALLSGEWAGAGGRILLDRNFSPPRWLALDGPWNMGGMLAGFDLGDNACELHEAPYGANMAFRRRMFEKYGLFRTDLGPSPNREIPRPNEDTEFGRRLIAAEERLVLRTVGSSASPCAAGASHKENIFWLGGSTMGALEREKRERARQSGVFLDTSSAFRE